MTSLLSAKAAAPSVCDRFIRRRDGIGLCCAGALALVLGSLPAAGEPLCKPQLSVQQTRFSGTQAQQRLWVAQVTADSARCAETSGRFTLGMDRIIEYGPDLRFFQPFEWRDGKADIWIVFGHDEAPTAHWIAEVAPCGCRR